MKTYAPWLVAGAAAVVACCATYIALSDRPSVAATAVSDRTKAMPSPSPIGSTAWSERRREVLTPRSDVAVPLKSTLASPQSRTRNEDVQPPLSATDSEAMITERAAARAEDERAFKDHVSSTAASFEREDRDQRWSSETGSALQVAFGSEALKGVSYQNIDCRTTMCRVEVVDDGSGAVGEALQKLASEIGSTLPSMLVDRIDQENGRATMVLYLSSK